MALGAPARRLVVAAPAKVNRFLHVTGRRADGYHTLESLFTLVDLADTVAIQVRDGSGTLVRELKGDDLKEKKKAGMHQVAWDLRREPLPKVKGQENEGRFGPGDRGPFVLPGTYQARLLVDGSRRSEFNRLPEYLPSDGEPYWVLLREKQKKPAGCRFYQDIVKGSAQILYLYKCGS